MAERLRVLRTRVRPGVIAAFDRWRGGPSGAPAGLAGALLPRDRAVRRPAGPGGRAQGRRRGAACAAAGGSSRYVPGGTAVWVPGSRVVAFGSHLAVKHVEYSVAGRAGRGLNVVNRAQQRFVPAKDRHLRIRLLLYSVRFRVHDALFGFRTGTSVRLARPAGGSTLRVPLQDGRATRSRRLPRGTYHVSVEAPGFSSARPDRAVARPGGQPHGRQLSRRRRSSGARWPPSRSGCCSSAGRALRRAFARTPRRAPRGGPRRRTGP